MKLAAAPLQTLPPEADIAQFPVQAGRSRLGRKDKPHRRAPPRARTEAEQWLGGTASLRGQVAATAAAAGGGAGGGGARPSTTAGRVEGAALMGRQPARSP